MGLFDFLKPYISREQFEKNTAGQKAASRRWKKTLMGFEEDPEALKQLEFFFYARQKENAEHLRQDLEKLGYRVYGISLSGDRRFSVIGLTTPLRINGPEMDEWIEQMNELGFVNDCFFDGWGMLSDPEP